MHRLEIPAVDLLAPTVRATLLQGTILGQGTAYGLSAMAYEWGKTER